jgi:hypothetical protein
VGAFWSIPREHFAVTFSRGEFGLQCFGT